MRAHREAKLTFGSDASAASPTPIANQASQAPPLGTCDLSRSPGASARSWALRVARRCQAVRSPPRQWRELWSVLRLSATGHAHTRPRQTAARARAEARPGASQPPERPLQGLKRGAHTCCGAPETRAVLSSSSCRTTRRKQRRCPRTGAWPACSSRQTRRRGASPAPAKASARAADAVGLGRSGTPHRPRSALAALAPGDHPGPCPRRTHAVVVSPPERVVAAHRAGAAGDLAPHVRAAR